MADHFSKRAAILSETIARLNTYKGETISVGRLSAPVEPGSVITVGDEKSASTSYTRLIAVALD